MIFGAKRRLGEVRVGLDGVRPGGMRDGRMLRFAEADTDFGFCRLNSTLCLQHGLARQGAGRIEPAERYTASPRSGVSELKQQNGSSIRFIAIQDKSRMEFV